MPIFREHSLPINPNLLILQYLTNNRCRPKDLTAKPGEPHRSKRSEEGEMPILVG